MRRVFSLNELILWNLIVLGCAFRLWSVWSANPVDFIFSDPQRHWDHAKEPLMSAPMVLFDPPVFQTWMMAVQKFTLGDRTLTFLYAGLLSIACVATWTLFLHEAVKDRRWALAGSAVLAWLPSWVGIYSYFMQETLFLPLLALSLWATWRARRLGGVGPFAWMVAFWIAAGLTRGIAIPMAAVATTWVWYRGPERGPRALVGMALVGLTLLPLGLRSRTFVGTFSPHGDGQFNAIYAASGAKTVEINLNRDGAVWYYIYQSPSVESRPLAPLSDWHDSREGRIALNIDLRNAAAGWDAARAAYTPDWGRRLELIGENLVFLAFGPSWPDNHPGFAVQALAVETRWIWVPLALVLVLVAVLGWRRGARDAGLLLALIGTWLFFQGGFLLAVNEGRYRKPAEGLLVAALVIIGAACFRRRDALQAAPGNFGPDGQRLPTADAANPALKTHEELFDGSLTIPLPAVAPAPLQAVIFDMDGLMLDTERLSQACWLGAAQDQAVPLPEGFLNSIVGCNLGLIRQRLLEVVGTEAAVEAFLERAEARYREVLAREVPVKPGLVELLQWLETRNLPRALATSTGRELADYKLRQAGVGERLTVRACGDEVILGKPAPDIYLLAAQRLGIEPQHCVALEDSPNGIRAAHAAGCRVLVVPDIAPISDEVRALATAVVPDLHEARRWLEANVG